VLAGKSGHHADASGLGSLNRWATSEHERDQNSCAFEEVSTHQLSLYSKTLPEYANDQKPGFDPLLKTIDVKQAQANPSNH